MKRNTTLEEKIKAVVYDEILPELEYENGTLRDYLNDWYASKGLNCVLIDYSKEAAEQVKKIVLDDDQRDALDFGGDCDYIAVDLDNGTAQVVEEQVFVDEITENYDFCLYVYKRCLLCYNK